VTAATEPRQRIFSVDVLRGFAVLGILLMNVGVLALPESGLGAPDSLPHNTGLNFAFWVANAAAVAGVFRALFSMLFGASVLLLTSRKAEDLGPEAVADVYYRRTLWLIAFGLVHAYLLLGWIDILFGYGIAGLFLFPFRRFRPRSLAVVGLLVLAVPLPFILRGIQLRHTARAAVTRVAELRAVGDTATTADQRLAKLWEDELRASNPTPASHQIEIATRRSGYWTNFRDLARKNVEAESSGLYRGGFWDVAGMMFLGMALLKWGILTAERSRRFYWSMLILGFAGGLGVKLHELQVVLSNHFDPLALEIAQATYHLGRLLMALGYIGALMLICRWGAFRRLKQSLCAVGRMALTNYIAQTVICVLLFYGVGFGLFGKLERWQLLYVVAGIWALQLVASPLWLARFRFGPLEWLWRSLTYKRAQPWRIAPAASGVRSPASTGG
jgi:uncharacterized protein